MIDLHLHSNFSDGTWSPDKVVMEAAKRGLKTIALTDHDSVGGIEIALRAAKQSGIELISAIELSTTHRGEETHFLGYFIDHHDSKLLACLKDCAEFRRKGVEEIVALLNKRGYNISMEAVEALSAHGYIGRPHIARVLCDLGVIERIKDAFVPELIGNGGDCYTPLSNLSVEEAIGIIERAGGLAIMAHPGAWPEPGKRIPDDDIESFVGMGLAGIECIHTRHSKVDKRHYIEMADDLGILKTGGSDCHGTYYNPVLIGSATIPSEWLTEMKNKLHLLKNGEFEFINTKSKNQNPNVKWSL